VLHVNDSIIFPSKLADETDITFNAKKGYPEDTPNGDQNWLELLDDEGHVLLRMAFHRQEQEVWLNSQDDLGDWGEEEKHSIANLISIANNKVVVTFSIGGVYRIVINNNNTCQMAYKARNSGAVFCVRYIGRHGTSKIFGKVMTVVTSDQWSGSARSRL
jgi:hypothetical protein